jgi:hypothetical protein
MLNTDPTNPGAGERFMRAALLLDRLSSNYEIEMRPDEAVEFLRRCEPENVSNDEWVSLVQEINHLIPPMQYGPDNPNTGQPHHTFRIGRDYSRVIYLRIVKRYLSTEPPFQYRETLDWDTLDSKLVHLAVVHSADEAWNIKNDEHEYQFRFWWD